MQPSQRYKLYRLTVSLCVIGVLSKGGQLSFVMRSYAIFAVIAVAQASLFARVNTGEVLAQVQASMRTGGSIDNIYKYLDDLEDQIRSEQSEHDTLYYKQVEDCDTEAEFRASEVSDAKFAIERADNELKECNAALGRSEILLDENQAEQIEAQTILEQIQAAREQEKALYDKRTQDHTDLIEAIDECLELMYELKTNKESLLQITNSMAKLLVKGSKANKTYMVAPIVTAFAQMKEVDQASVDRVIELFNRLRANTIESQEDYDQKEADSIAAFTEQFNNLVAHIEDLKEDEKTLNKHIADMKSCVADQTAVLNEATAKEDRNSDLLNSSADLCDDFINEYKTETKSREDELHLIEEIRALVSKRLNQLSPGAYARANSDDFGEYQNQYETST